MPEAVVDYKTLYEEQKQVLEQQQLTIVSLQLQIENLKKLIYGSRHEKFNPSNNNSSQLSLDIQAEEMAAVKISSAQKIEYTRVKTEAEQKHEHPGRYKLPEHLERREKIIEPEENTEGLKKIGEEITEELDYEPGKLFVNKIIRPKYARQNNEGVIIAPMIERPLPKAIAGAGLLAQIVIDKYVDHLPLYRQQERFKREGVNIPYSTLTDMISGTVQLIAPLYDAHKKIILASNYLHADETPQPVLDKEKKGSTHRGYFWVYHNSIEKLVLFDYQPGRGREGPQQMLKNFKGYLQTDGYSVYDFFKDEKDIVVLHCMAHARRMFYEAQQNDKARTEYALTEFAKLYAIEKSCREKKLSFDEIKNVRSEKSLPILASLGEWMRQQYVQVLPKSVIGKALSYCIERWNELMTYTADGRLNIDNNPVERSIRPVAIGRKNYLFAGSHEAAQRSAMLYSLLGTCKLHEVNPFIWLRNVLQCIATHPINKIEELLPQNWQAPTDA